MSEENTSSERWLAYELHDGLLQWLISARMGVESALPDLEPAQSAVSARLRNTLTLLESALDEGRELIGFLENQGATADVSFESEIATFIEKVRPELDERGQHVDYVWPAPPWPRLPPRTSWNLLRIAQQALRNAMQHAGPCNIEIVCGWQDSATLSLLIRDDGCGFQLDEAAREPGHYGMASMEQRANLIGGHFEVNSVLGSSTSIRIVLPISESSAGQEGTK